MIARVLIDGPSELVFDYAIPEGLAVVEGCRVRVPIRQKTSSGTVLSVIPTPEQSEFAMREVKSLIDPEPLITPTLLKVARWIANYYGSSIESVIRSILPAVVFFAQDPLSYSSWGAVASIFGVAGIVYAGAPWVVRLSNRWTHILVLTGAACALPVNATGAVSVAAAVGWFNRIVP